MSQQPKPFWTHLALRALGLCALVTPLSACSEEPPSEPPIGLSLSELGEELFHDTVLSQNQTQACATCHDPEGGYADGRTDAAGRVRPVSLGDDGVSFGGRNAPSAAYALFSPPFSKGQRQRFNKQNSNRLYQGYLGGLFWDGRAPTLADQAGGPPLNPIEMGMTDEFALMDRLEAHPRYGRAFRELFGSEIFDDPLGAYASMTGAIAAYESDEATFAPFDSKYDRSLRNEEQLSFKELTGKSVFFSEFANCGICHQLHAVGDPVNKIREPFTGFEFHNVGTPANPATRRLSQVGAPDIGLAANPAVPEADRADARGKFKVPTLRNVAVTGPYMHNGVFVRLSTVVEFYAQFTDPQNRRLNPETGERWAPPEVPETVARDLLRVGDRLTDLQIESLVCFLRALTDARFEDRIPDEPGIDCAD